MSDIRIKDLQGIDVILDKLHQYIVVDGDGEGASEDITNKMTIKKLSDAIQGMIEGLSANQIGSGNISNDEYERLSGVSANIQSQLDEKVSKPQSVGNQVLISKSDGEIEESQISIEELNKLSGVNANIQSQLDGKSEVVHTHIEEEITDLDKYSKSEVDSLINSQIMRIPGGINGGCFKGDKVEGFGESSSLSDKFTINVNVPSNSIILGCQLRVDSSLNRNWDARYDDGNDFNQSICSNSDKAMNTRINKFFDVHSMSNITTNEVDILISSHDGIAFDNNGKIYAIVYIMRFCSLGVIGG